MGNHSSPIRVWDMGPGCQDPKNNRALWRAPRPFSGRIRNRSAELGRRATRIFWVFLVPWNPRCQERYRCKGLLQHLFVAKWLVIMNVPMVVVYLELSPRTLGKIKPIEEISTCNWMENEQWNGYFSGMTTSNFSRLSKNSIFPGAIFFPRSENSSGCS